MMKLLVSSRIIYCNSYIICSNYHLHNGYGAAFNTSVQATKAKARGFWTAKHFIAMCFLIAGKLTHLPVNPLEKARPLP